MTASLALLANTWQQRAGELAPYAPAAAEAFRRAAGELEEALRGADESVTIQEAHAIGGYSVDHLQRLVSSGQLPNAGKRGRPRIRRVDVPVKPGHAALRQEDAARQLSASAVVASAITRRDT